MRADGWAARRLTELEFDFANFRPTWTVDGRSILFVRGQVNVASAQLLRVDVKSRAVTALEGLGQGVGRMSAWGNRLVYTQWKGGQLNIHRVPISPNPSAASEPVVTSSFSDQNADISPDGSRLVFSSDRSGFLNIWMCKSDGADPVQLTSFEEHTGTPRWSPDGRQVLFDSLHSGNWDLWLIDPEQRVPRQLTTDLSDETMGTWSRDGQWVYFQSTRTGRQEIWKMPSEGGEAVQVTEDGGSYAVESRDGSFLYYTQPSTPGLWQLPNRKGGRGATGAVPGCRQVLGRRGARHLLCGLCSAGLPDPISGP